MKQVNVTFEDGEHEALSEAKDDRTWHDAILEEFGVGGNR